MSNYLYVQCLDHSPPLRAEGESTQHLERDLDEVRSWLADRKSLTDRRNDSVENYSHDGFLNTADFIDDHAGCRINLIAETGQEFPVLPGQTDANPRGGERITPPPTDPATGRYRPANPGSPYPDDLDNYERAILDIVVRSGGLGIVDVMTSASEMIPPWCAREAYWSLISKGFLAADASGRVTPGPSHRESTKPDARVPNTAEGAGGHGD